MFPYNWAYRKTSTIEYEVWKLAVTSKSGPITPESDEDYFFYWNYILSNSQSLSLKFIHRIIIRLIYEFRNIEWINSHIVNFGRFNHFPLPRNIMSLLEFLLNFHFNNQLNINENSPSELGLLGWEEVKEDGVSSSATPIVVVAAVCWWWWCVSTSVASSHLEKNNKEKN